MPIVSARLSLRVQQSDRKCIEPALIRIKFSGARL